MPVVIASRACAVIDDGNEAKSGDKALSERFVIMSPDPVGETGFGARI
jgi:hypothetical protein